jgi:hypothetical protein
MENNLNSCRVPEIHYSRPSFAPLTIEFGRTLTSIKKGREDPFARKRGLGRH